MNVAVYIAGRSEDVTACRELREQLAAAGLACTSRWLDSFDRDPAVGAERDLEDLRRASALVLYKPLEVHRIPTTGGHHVELGYALAIGKPVFLFGEPENVFHHLADVVRVHPSVRPEGLAAVIRIHVKES